MTQYHRSAGCRAGKMLLATACAAPGLTPLPGQAAESALAPVVITGLHYDNAVGSSDAASQGSIRSQLLSSRPAQRPGEVLEFVPGLIVTQHSGDGKANQYFLRGFNLDHGTDFATTVGGVPVNMSTHAHGQGYTDLNFLIPELVERIDYRKGPYFATHGDFASAGAADIVYRQRLAAPFVQVTLGERGYRRSVAAASTALNEDATLLGAVEWMGNEGPWSVPEALRRKNAVLTLSRGSRADGWSATLMAYDAHWTATDQVPQRLIDAGSYQGRPFGRFDSLDATDGGRTSRYSLSAERTVRNGDSLTRASVYAMAYRLQLYSNFTYALDRPASGDQFAQRDDRNVYGLSASHAWPHALMGREARSEVGVQLRHDRIELGLDDTQARQTLNTTRQDGVRQTMASAYAQTQWSLTPWLRTVAGVRLDQARFEVDSRLLAANSGRATQAQVSPKLSLIAGPWRDTEVFVNAGRGLHSNDARGTTTRIDPISGDAVQPVRPLAASRGWELGLRTQAVRGLQSSLALWQLRFDSELSYLGDAGTTEARGASVRRGIEWNNRWAPSRRWLFDADLAYTHARFEDGQRIPNAVDMVASLAATLKNAGPWSTSLQWRYLGSGALTGDNTQRSPVSSLFNARVAREMPAWLGRNSLLTVDVFNLLNRRANDITYFYASRVAGEAAATDDRHVHPAEPRTVRVTLKVGF